MAKLTSLCHRHLLPTCIILNSNNMKKETVSVKDRIVEVVGKSPDGLDKKSLADATVKGIQLEGALSKLIKEKVLKMEEREGVKFYFVNPEIPEIKTTDEKKGKEVDDATILLVKKGTAKSKKEKQEEKLSDEGDEKENVSDKNRLSEGKRDMRRFKFQGQKYTKGGLVHAVVSAFVAKKKNIGITTLKENFPDELIQRFGVFQEISKAKQFTSGGRDRFFMKDEMLIKLKDKKIAVCNQWTAENIKPFLSAARKLGFEIR